MLLILISIVQDCFYAFFRQMKQILIIKLTAFLKIKQNKLNNVAMNTKPSILPGSLNVYVPNHQCLL